MTDAMCSLRELYKIGHGPSHRYRETSEGGLAKLYE